ncbi:MAG: phosphoribosylamine--glycine ligase [Lewinellaceae bacterium]|nr:phosphoribosylamine--glycine ligase [Lewinellaceae bacterium]
MNILLVGSGGREHAMAAKIVQSPLCDKLFIAPGNPGTENLGMNIDLGVSDFKGLEKAILHHNIEMLVVGPEVPLAEGIRDYIEPLFPNLMIIGPGKLGAQLESSKAFSKRFMQRHGIPTAAYIEVNQENIEVGIHYLNEHQGPYVLKADGLAAGKGVLIIENNGEAISELKNMLSGKFGTASETVIIEQFLSGIEFSVFVLTDGKDYVLLPEAKDYKRIGEGDTGLNTGGMGAVSPVPFFDAGMKIKVIDRIIRPTIEGLESEDIPYQGFIFFGLIDVGGDPYVIEYNCRMGDPETEVVFPRIESDMVDLFIKSGVGKLSEYQLLTNPLTAATVMLVSEGYPDAYEKGKVITGDVDKPLVFHAGTRILNGNMVTNGGRVMALTSLGEDIPSAIKNSLTLAESIRFEGKYYRRDIGLDLIS